jgi:hypothetical protein
MNECIVCGCAGSVPIYPAILQCPSCGTMAADVQMSDEELSRLYSKKYFFGEEYSNYIRDQRVLEKNFVLRLKVLDHFLGNTSEKNLLEIGSAYGFF